MILWTFRGDLNAKSLELFVIKQISIEFAVISFFAYTYRVHSAIEKTQLISLYLVKVNDMGCITKCLKWMFWLSAAVFLIHIWLSSKSYIFPENITHMALSKTGQQIRPC